MKDLSKLNNINIHATCIDYQGIGILITGTSGSGKSDLALRLIMDKGARLVADDRTNLSNQNGRLLATCPDHILGQIEVRGLGICQFSPCLKTEIKLVVNLAAPSEQIERLPDHKSICLCGLDITEITLHGYEASAPDKVILACYQNK